MSEHSAEKEAVCPVCGKSVYTSKHWSEWACSDPRCVNAHGPGPGGGHVHNHLPWPRGGPRRDADGQLRGACLNDDGTRVTPPEGAES